MTRHALSTAAAGAAFALAAAAPLVARNQPSSATGPQPKQPAHANAIRAQGATREIVRGNVRSRRIAAPAKANRRNVQVAYSCGHER